MKINGFQKLTLLDFPGKVACIIFTPGCNFRCPFCHNASLVTHIDNTQQYTEEEILEYLKKRNGIIDGVCITGGEPLLQSDIEEFIIKVKALGLSVKLDTNGYYPEKLISLVKNGLLDYVAMDIKNSKEKYSLTAGIQGLNIANIEKSVSFLLENHVPYEFRTTVVDGLHTPQDIVSIAHWIMGANKYFLQNFVDSGDILGEKMAPLSQNELEILLKTAQNSGLKAFLR